MQNICLSVETQRILTILIIFVASAESCPLANTICSTAKDAKTLIFLGNKRRRVHLAISKSLINQSHKILARFMPITGPVQLESDGSGVAERLLSPISYLSACLVARQFYQCR